MTYGENILAKSDGGTLGPGQYSFGAKLAKKSTLKIVITNLSSVDPLTSGHPIWLYDSPKGWRVDDYDFTNNTQVFTSVSTGNIDLRIQFDHMGAATNGSCKIDFYENGTKLHHSNKFYW